ncbi:hypothetical protein [Amycolatopsis sp. H20-H5]|uniref:hypothetical protein n=1 Tax=Amycolatopsis sp. H20-H5 TaxID=3046309 RepID=UPI002DB6A3A2|nr:hypothetical protein [Amycolatopsis sp. H20-H5]MEC3974596.1 hypothetical protein [Amycolatopsis sp. H20-H5]
MSWAEERRANKVVDAEQARFDAEAATERRIRERGAYLADQRTDRDTADTKRTASRDARRTRRTAQRVKLGAWLSAHRVDLPIYLLAVASGVMAVPSMAAYGFAVYGNATGAVLPVLSELGMWAFALAVQVTRKSSPDRPVWALQTGVWTFAGVAFGLNVLHGLDRGIDAAVVMGVASVAGVIAHQLAVAAPRRSATERAASRIDRRVLRKTSRIQVAAVRHAVAEIDATGTATLVFAAGRYVLDRRGRLTEAVESRSPVDPADRIAEQLAEEAAAWLATQDRPGPSTLDPAGDSGAVATLDSAPDLRESTPNPDRVRTPKTRSFDQLWTDFQAALLDPSGAMDPTSAVSIRKTLHCSAARARQLRDDYRANR